MIRETSSKDALWLVRYMRISLRCRALASFIAFNSFRVPAMAETADPMTTREKTYSQDIEEPLETTGWIHCWRRWRIDDIPECMQVLDPERSRLGRIGCYNPALVTEVCSKVWIITHEVTTTPTTCKLAHGPQQ